MENEHSLEAAELALRARTGVAIPVYFPEGDDPLGRALLADLVRALTRQTDDPACICLCADGREHGWEVVEEIARQYGASAVCAPQNRGKLHALRHAVAHLWERGGLQYVATVDADGDHFANELLNLVRAALHAQGRAGGEVLVLGRRLSRHRPMGFERGELEELADRVLLDALYYRAAVQGAPLRLEYATLHEEFPDFHSGFKLFSRQAARAVFMEEPRLCGAEEEGYFRHGCEAVMTVEALEAGARLVLVNRSTFNEQPVSAFGRLDRARLASGKIVWPCRRLEVPTAFVDQWLRNHLPRLLLATAPGGREQLTEIYRLVLEGMGVPVETEMDWGPLFL